MRNFVDSSTLSSENKQTQYSWMLEFEQPVLAYRELEQTLTNVLQKFQGELPSGGEIAWSGLKMLFRMAFLIFLDKKCKQYHSIQLISSNFNFNVL